jgi:hypothetical protein
MVGASEHDRQTIAAWIFGKSFVRHRSVLLQPLFWSESLESLTDPPRNIVRSGLQSGRRHWIIGGAIGLVYIHKVQVAVPALADPRRE